MITPMLHMSTDFDGWFSAHTGGAIGWGPVCQGWIEEAAEGARTDVGLTGTARHHRIALIVFSSVRQEAGSVVT